MEGTNHLCDSHRGVVIGPTYSMEQSKFMNDIAAPTSSSVLGHVECLLFLEEVETHLGRITSQQKDPLGLEDRGGQGGFSAASQHHLLLAPHGQENEAHEPE